MKRVTFLLTCVLFVIVSVSDGDDYYWSDPAGGELGDPTKWSPSETPGEDDYVNFFLPNSYSVWLDDFYTHDRLTVDGSDLTLNLNGYEYMLDTTNDHSRSVVIGDLTTGSVTVTDGGVLSRDLFLGRNGDDSFGRLNLSGEGTYWIGYIYPDYHGFFYGNAGDAELSLTDNAYLEHGHGQTATGSSAVTVTVDGQDTEWFVAGYFGMSGWGRTSMTLSNGGRARYGYLEMAINPRSSAVIDVTGASHETELVIENGWWDPVSLFIGRGGTGIINLSGSKLYHEGHTIIAEWPGSRGELNINDGSWADCLGSVAVGGKLDTQGGQGLLYLYDADPYNNNYADLTCAPQDGESMIVWPQGKVMIDGGRITMEYDTDTANQIVLNGGTLQGWGWIYAQVNNESGVVEPGAVGSWKHLNLFYNYRQGANGTLKIGIAGTVSAWDYSVLNATVPGRGQVTLDGFLDVDLESGFVPDYFDEFVIIEADTVSGRFRNAESDYFFESGTFEVIYESNRVLLTHFQSEPKCLIYPVADLNKDCAVNLTDFVIMAGQWLQCELQPDSYCPEEM